MHYYQFNIGDYHSHTSHLDPLEDIAYRRMLDWIYLHESPLPDNVQQIAKFIRMRDEYERITDVLQEFFDLTEYGYTQKKAMEEIERFNDKSQKAKAAINKRWDKERNKSNTDVLPTNNECNTNHKPITNNQYICAFDDFWGLYDKKVNKQKAEKLFSKLNKNEIDLIFKTLPDYIRSKPDKQFRKDPDTYLRNKCWTDEIIINKPTSSVNGFGTTQRNKDDEDYWLSFAGQPKNGGK